MKERGIIMSASMVLALLAGSKTQTRRIAHIAEVGETREETIKFLLSHCPYGVAGDRLWVRETFALHDATGPYQGKSTFAAIRLYRADDEKRKEKWTPSIFMPRWASRITLEITRVRVERVQDISEEDAKAEGVRPNALLLEAVLGAYPTYRMGYRQLWDSLHGKGAWEKNPWVWVLELMVMKGEKK